MGNNRWSDRRRGSAWVRLGCCRLVVLYRPIASEFCTRCCSVIVDDVDAPYARLRYNSRCAPQNAARQCVIFMMVVVVILNFVKPSYLTHDASVPSICQMRWKSAEGFTSYITLLKFKMAISAILNGVVSVYIYGALCYFRFTNSTSFSNLRKIAQVWFYHLGVIWCSLRDISPWDVYDMVFRNFA